MGDECKEAAQQFAAEWKAKMKSGFPKTGSTSALKYVMDWDSRTVNQWHWPEDGFEPRFRKSQEDSSAPIGCYMDRNHNFIYWNTYKQSTPNEWSVDATFTELGGLIHASDSRTFGIPVVGVCKSPEAVSTVNELLHEGVAAPLWLLGKAALLLDKLTEPQSFYPE